MKKGEISGKSKTNKTSMAKWQSKKQNQKTIFLMFAVVPAMVGYIVFDLYPNVLSAYYSMLDWNGVAAPKFIWFDNFIKMARDAHFWHAATNSLIMLLVFPISVIIISLLLAYALTNKSYPEFRIHQNIFFIPNVLSSVIIALIFTFLYDGGFGLINAFINAVGHRIGAIGANEVFSNYWLGMDETALPAVLLTMIWGGVGFYLIIFMNAMKGIPKSIYESAILDGATNMVRLFKITVPLIWPIIKVSLMFLMIGSIKTYEIVLVLTGGGPVRATDVLGLYMFNFAFGNTAQNQGTHYFGYASAIGMFMFVVLVGSKLLTDKFTKKDAVEY
ncbi:MAG: sugar ABC transporter permease [Clostridia bacterium]|jgi:N-acetylglucosamine transport system permease protein